MKKHMKVLFSILSFVFIVTLLSLAHAEEWCCQNCGENNSSNFCTNCGAKKPESLKCSSCGKEYSLSDGYKYCPNCGNLIDSSGSADKSEEQPSSDFTNKGYTNTTVNFREKPDRNSPRIRVLKKYALLTILDFVESKEERWVQVEFNGETGYMIAEYVQQLTEDELESFLDSPEYEKGLENNGIKITLTEIKKIAPASSPSPSPSPYAGNLKVSMTFSSNTFSQPEEIDVTIEITNDEDVPTPGEITLFYPKGNKIEEFDTSPFSAGEKREWTGKWTVTQAELEAGRITFEIRYKKYNEDGQLVDVSKRFSKKINYRP